MDNRSGLDPETPTGDRRSIVGLVRELANDSANLVRQEIALAKAELRQNVTDIAKHVSQLAVGTSIAVLGLLVFITFLIVGLGALLGGIYWLSTLIVALVLLVAGVGLAFLGVKRIAAASMAPKETLASVKTTTRWAGDELSSLRASLRNEPSLSSGSPPGAVRPGALVTEDGIGHPPSRRSASTPSRGARSHSHAAARLEADRLPLSEPLWTRVVHEVKENDVTGQGAKLAYFMFTTLPPALLVLFGIAGFVGGGVGDYIAGQIQGVVPGAADDPASAAGFLNRFVQQVVSERAPGPFSIGLVTGLWASSALFVALSDSLNKAYGVAEDRSWIRRRATAIGVMVGFVLLFVGGSLILIAGPQIADALQLGGVADVVWSVAQWPLAFGLVVLAFFLAYYVLPNRDQSARKTVLLKGSAMAAMLWLIASIGFRIYITNFGSYSETYGFVGAILVLLLWMYLTGVVILVGGEISSEMEREV